MFPNCHCGHNYRFWNFLRVRCSRLLGGEHSILFVVVRVGTLPTNQRDVSLLQGIRDGTRQSQGSECSSPLLRHSRVVFARHCVQGESVC